MAARDEKHDGKFCAYRYFDYICRVFPFSQNMKLAWCLLVAFAVLSCSRHDARQTVRSAYYWSTTLNIDSQKADFIKRHGLSRLYVRYFDVVQGDDGRPTPNATLHFQTGVPDSVEVIPTVFIVNDCMRGDTTGLARKILDRVMQMSETHDVKGVKEVQMDCDWTLTTRCAFYGFLSTMRRMCHERGLKLSATVRFHQLSQPPPPTDRGVLMVYNTGDFTRLDCQKPILDIADVRPYLRHLAHYELPLAQAYPVYSWRLLFRDTRFVGIMHTDDELPVLPGDSIVTRQPCMEDLLAAQKAVDDRLTVAEWEVIIFDLSNQNILHFNSSEYEKIFGN